MLNRPFVGNQHGSPAGSVLASGYERAAIDHDGFDQNILFVINWNAVSFYRNCVKSGFDFFKEGRWQRGPLRWNLRV